MVEAGTDGKISGQPVAQKNFKTLFCVLILFFQDKVSPCSPGCPEPGCFQSAGTNHSAENKRF